MNDPASAGLAGRVHELMPQLTAQLTELVAIPSVSEAGFPEASRPPLLRTRSSTALCSACSSSGMIGGSRPSTSAAGQPNIRSAAGFHSSTERSVLNATIASAALSTTARAVASTRFCPVCWSRATTSWCHQAGAQAGQSAVSNVTAAASRCPGHLPCTTR